MKRNWCLSALIGSMMALAPAALAGGDIEFGPTAVQDGEFNYQGFLEIDGEPANGMYSFQFEAFDSPVGPGVVHENFYTSPTVPVVDGLFSVDIQMGGTPAEALRFWREVGNQEMYLEIRVGEIEGGPYTTLGTRTKVGWSARAQYSGISDSLKFPYTDTYGNGFGDQDTMFSLTHQFGGTVFEANAGLNMNSSILSVNSATPSGVDFFAQTGGIHIDAEGRHIGLVSIADQYAVVGALLTPSGNQAAGLLGQIDSDVPGAVAVQALNFSSGNSATLGTPDYAGDFNGDVIARSNLRVQDEITRDFASNNPSPVGPLAYGSVTSNGTLGSGTANISSSWDAANTRYVISVAGETMAFTTHTVSVTVVDTSEPRVATFNTTGGNILVKIWDINSGNIAVQDNFSIVIHDANPVVLNRLAVPNDVDLDKYSEKTGAQVIQTRPRVDPVEPFESYGSGVSGQN